MALDRARADLAQLQQRATRLRAELAEVETAIHKVTIYLEMAEAYETGADGQSFRHAIAGITPKTGRPRGGHSETIETAVRLYLREVRRPISTIDLLDMLTSQGITVGGEKPRNNLSGILSRAEGFTNDRGRGWGLMEWSSQDTPSVLGLAATSSNTSPLLPEQSVPDVQE